jgi:hypothetical protein
MGTESITCAKSIARGRFAANYDTSKVFFWQKSYGFEVECMNNIREKKSKIVIFSYRKSPLILEDFIYSPFFVHTRRRWRSFFRNKNGCSLNFYIVSCNFALFRESYRRVIFSSKVPKLKKTLFKNVLHF